MANIDVMYRAYKEWKKIMNSVTNYSKITKAFADEDHGSDEHDGVIAIREIDMDWVEALEKALPHIDSAIREQRRFIVSQEEIVPIEKSRRITTESVRHLAQHTNLIAKVENGEVTPESILNIYREESFAIYENRFLRTVLKRATEFVEERFEALINVNSDSVAHLNMKRNIELKDETINFELSYSTEYKNSIDVKVTDDISGLTQYQRLLRIRKILADYMATPLMRELKSAEPVRPPITRTNLILKNPHFRAVLDLWTFLESYTKKGYYSIMSDAKGEMSQSMKDGFYDIANFTRFMIRMNLDQNIQTELENEYLAENERLEILRKEQEKERLKSYVEEYKVRYENKILTLKQKQKDEIRKLENHFESTTAKYKNHINTLTKNHLVEVEELKKSMETMKINNEKTLNDLNVFHQKIVNELEEKLNQKCLDYENQIALIKQQYDGKVHKLNSEIVKVKEDYDQKIDELLLQHNNHIKTLNLNYDKKIDDEKNEYLAQIEVLKDSYEKIINDQEAYYQQLLDTQKQQLITKTNKEIELLRNEKVHLEVKKNTLEQMFCKKMREVEALAATNKKLKEKISKTQKYNRVVVEYRERRFKHQINKLQKRLDKEIENETNKKVNQHKYQ